MLNYKFWVVDALDGSCGCCKATAKLDFSSSGKVYPTRIVAALAGAHAVNVAAAKTMAFAKELITAAPRALGARGALAPAFGF